MSKSERTPDFLRDEHPELLGRLLLITPHRIVENTTASGTGRDAVLADVAVLDGDSAPTTYPQVYLTPLILQGQIKRNIGTGRPVLGRLVQGVQRPGQRPPLQLADPTEADKEIARAFLRGQGEVHPRDTVA